MSCLYWSVGGCQIWCNPCLNFFQKVQFFRGSVVTGWTGYDVVQLHIGLVRDGIVFLLMVCKGHLWVLVSVAWVFKCGVYSHAN